MKSYSVIGALFAGLMITLAPLGSAGAIGISGATLIVGTEPGDGATGLLPIAGRKFLHKRRRAMRVTAPMCAGAENAGGSK